jgi:predicted nucleic acid-binding protein
VVGVTYDTGALVAAERGQRRMWSRHRALLVNGDVPTVAAPVVAQAWRGGGGQALLARLLRGCDIESLSDVLARSVGTLAAKAGTTDIIDAAVAEGALHRRDLVISSDSRDLQAIAGSVHLHLEVEPP